jgi:hypothetical protein
VFAVGIGGGAVRNSGGTGGGADANATGIGGGAGPAVIDIVAPHSVQKRSPSPTEFPQLLQMIILTSVLDHCDKRDASHHHYLFKQFANKRSCFASVI